jgi:hypothetical protein
MPSGASCAFNLSKANVCGTSECTGHRIDICGGDAVFFEYPLPWPHRGNHLQYDAGRLGLPQTEPARAAERVIQRGQPSVFSDANRQEPVSSHDRSRNHVVKRAEAPPSQACSVRQNVVA